MNYVSALLGRLDMQRRIQAAALADPKLRRRRPARPVPAATRHPAVKATFGVR